MHSFLPFKNQDNVLNNNVKKNSRCYALRFCCDMQNLTYNFFFLLWKRVYSSIALIHIHKTKKNKKQRPIFFPSKKYK